MKKLAGIVFALAFVVAANGAVVAQAHAASTVSTLESLMAKVAELQAELAKLRGEVRETLRDGIKEGMTDEDIQKIQELLATDSSIYPEGKITGYFGSLTKAALKRFQAKHDLEVTGEINAETKELLEEYLKERFNGKIPQGLLRAPGIWKKVHDNVCSHEKVVARGLFCKDFVKPPMNSDEFEVEVEIEDGVATVSFTFDGDDYTIETDSMLQSVILEAVADELDEDLEDVDKDLVREIRMELAKAIADNDEGRAQQAIDEAEDAIDDVQEDIDAADNDVDTDDAQDALDDAQETLEDAEDAFDDEDFEEAKDLADEAKDQADEAADLLDDAEDEANN